MSLNEREKNINISNLQSPDDEQCEESMNDGPFDKNGESMEGGSAKESNRGSNAIGDYYQQVLQSAAVRLKNNMDQRKTGLYQQQKIDEELLLQSLPQRPVANFPSEDDRKRIVGCLASILSLASAHESQQFETTHVHQDYSSTEDATDSNDHHLDENVSLLPTDNSSASTSTSFYSLKPSEKNKERVMNRHLRRRHDVYSNFLVRSTELLFLDKSHAYAFLPILSRLLLSPHKLNSENCTHFSPRLDSVTNNNNNNTKSTDSSFEVEECKEQSNTSFSSSLSRKSSASSRSVEWGNFQTADEENNCESSHTIHNDDDDDAHPLQDHFESLNCSGNIEQNKNKDESSKHHKVQAYSFQKDKIGINEINSKLSLADYLYNSSDDESCCDSSDVDHNINSIHEVKVPQHEQEDQQIHNKSVEDNKHQHSSNGFHNSNDKLPTSEVTKRKKSKKRPERKEGPSSNHIATTWYNNPLLQPFLESITPGAGMQCVSFLLLQHLLRNSSEGYDARIRHVLKKLAIVIFMHESKPGSNKNMESETELALHATRKFEALEHGIALRLLNLSGSEQSQRNEEEGQQNVKERQLSKESSVIRINRDSIVRGLKIGSAGVVAGTLFAVTGGLAAPGIAAGLAALGTTTVASAAVMTTLTSTATVTTIFGVGGGSLYAYKTHRRTQGLTEFEFTKEGAHSRVRKSQKERKGDDAELFTTICLAGWLQDNRDFQRPWGVTPTTPPIDRLEKLERFYLIYKPENIKRCSRILHQWKGEERQLWQFLRKKYGRDPDHLFPLNNGPRKTAALTHEEEEGINLLLNELGYFVARKKKETREEINPTYSLPIQKLRSLRRTSSKGSDSVVAAIPHATSSHSSLRNLSSQSDHTNDSIKNLKIDENEKNSTNEANTGHKIKRQVGATTKVWDYFSEFGGELYTVKWESKLLMELCDSVVDVAVDLVHGAAREVLKQTALAALLTAVALPYALVQAASMIDGTWTLAIERADEAGIELARTLLESQAGHRPVVLVGFSMGARTIYSCLKELAKHQRRWEEQHMTGDDGDSRIDENDTTKTSNNDGSIQYRREPASIVEDAILMGTPNHLSVESWALCRQVVAGRLVNCFSRKDLILSLMFQFKRLALRSVCGTSPVNVTGVEDVDVSHLISSHSDYCFMSGDILRLVGHGQPSYKNVFNSTTERNSNEIMEDAEDVNILEKLDEGIPTLSNEEKRYSERNISASNDKSINGSTHHTKRKPFFSSLSSETCEY